MCGMLLRNATGSIGKVLAQAGAVRVLGGFRASAGGPSFLPRCPHLPDMPARLHLLAPDTQPGTHPGTASQAKVFRLAKDDGTPTGKVIKVGWWWGGGGEGAQGRPRLPPPCLPAPVPMPSLLSCRLPAFIVD